MSGRASSAAPTTAGQGAASGVATLFSVRIRHAYYNLQDERCPDFSVAPTADCAALLQRLGILTQVGADGFRVLAPRSRLPAIAAAILRGAQAGGDGVGDGLGGGGTGFWTRLTYSLVLRNPAFYGFTALPLDTSAAGQGLWVSNLQTVATREGLRLGGRGGLGADALVPTTGATLSFQAPAGTVVTASDIAGQPVRSVTVAAGQPPALDLSGLPGDRYAIAADPPDGYVGPSGVLYAPARPPSAGLPSAGLIDLLLARPDAETGLPAAFPIGGLSASAKAGGPADPPVTPTVQAVDLTLSFEARRTVWKYFVVALGGTERQAGDLSITGDGATFRTAAQPVPLPNGETATLIQSTGTLPLRQRSPYRFALSGRSQGADGSRDRISVDPLPGAPAHPVWPAASGNRMSGSSEIFVYV